MRNSLKRNEETEETVYLERRGAHEISSAQCQLALPDVACVVIPWRSMEKLYGLHCHRTITAPEKLFFLP